MRNKSQKFSLLLIGAVAGVLLSINFSAIADKETNKTMPPSSS